MDQIFNKLYYTTSFFSRRFYQDVIQMNNIKLKIDTERVEKNSKYLYPTYYFSNIHYFFKEPTRIIDNVFIGNGTHSENLDLLKKNNFKHIFNCAINIPNYYPTDFNYVKLPLQDDKTELKLINLIPLFIENMNQIKNEMNTDDSIFIHCEFGKSRSIAFMIIYIMYYHEKSFDEAYKIAKFKRPVIDMNLNFKKDILEYFQKNPTHKNKIYKVSI